MLISILYLYPYPALAIDLSRLFDFRNIEKEKNAHVAEIKLVDVDC